MRRYRLMMLGAAVLLLGLLSACGGAPSTGTSGASEAASASSSVAASVAASEAASMAASEAASPSAAASEAASEAASPSAAASEAASTSAASAASSASTIPLYTGATPLGATSPISIFVATIKQQLTQQQSNANVTVDAYALPAGTTFDQVRQFYNSALTADGWQDATGQANMPTMPGGGLAVWQKNGTEVVTVMVSADPTSNGGTFMILAHATPK